MKPKQIITIGALATAMTFGLACGNKVEAPKGPTPEQVAAQEVIDAKTLAMDTYKEDLAEYNTAVTQQKVDYTHTVTGPEAMWDLVGQYGGDNDVQTIDTICQENGMKYLSLPPEVLRWEPMTSVMEDGKQVNCNILYEGQVLDFSYFAPELEKPVMPN